jgi:hypothetical protein
MVKIDDVKPGQSWMWTFTYNDGTWWFEHVSITRRSDFVSGMSGMEMIKRGEIFLIVATNDLGPCKIPGEDYSDEYGSFFPIVAPPKHWHIALIRNRCVWISHDDLDHASLVNDTK